MFKDVSNNTTQWIAWNFAIGHLLLLNYLYLSFGRTAKDANIARPAIKAYARDSRTWNITMLSTRRVPPALGMAPELFLDSMHIQHGINTQDISSEIFAKIFGQFRNLSAIFRNRTGNKLNDGEMKFSEVLNSNYPIFELF